MDTMLQFSILGQSTRELYLPTRLQRAIINTKQHKQIVEALSEGEGKLRSLVADSKIEVASNIKHFGCSPIRSVPIISLLSFLRMKKAGL
jgi:hypothetical protein